MTKNNFYSLDGLTVIRLEGPTGAFVEVRHDTSPHFSTTPEKPETTMNVCSFNPGQDIDAAAAYAVLINRAVAFARVLRATGTPTPAEIENLRRQVMGE